jgi:cold shock CspA family protein
MFPATVVVEVGKVVFGRVKWFNPKNGYGFITLCNSDCDVFVHHKSITVVNSNQNQYKYLMTGEYVQFIAVVVDDPDSKYKYQASKVTGIHGGALMCETRNEMMSRDSKRKNSDVPEIN